MRMPNTRRDRGLRHHGHSASCSPLTLPKLNMAGLRKSGDRSDRDSHDEPPVELVPAPHPGSTSSGGSSRPTQSVPRRRLVLDRDHPGPPPSLPLPPPPSASDTPVIGMTSPSPADLPISTPEDRLFVLCLDALVHVTDMWVTTASSASERSSCHRIGRDVGTLREQHTTQNFTSRFDEGDLGGRQTVLTLLGEILIIVHTGKL